jgi:hypothetical protein
MVLMYAAAGEVMVGLSSSYRALGRSEDALAMNEKALALLRRTLPQNHPNLSARPAIHRFHCGRIELHR